MDDTDEAAGATTLVVLLAIDSAARDATEDAIELADDATEEPLDMTPLTTLEEEGAGEVNPTTAGTTEDAVPTATLDTLVTILEEIDLMDDDACVARAFAAAVLWVAFVAGFPLLNSVILSQICAICGSTNCRR